MTTKPEAFDMERDALYAGTPEEEAGKKWCGERGLIGTVIIRRGDHAAIGRLLATLDAEREARRSAEAQLAERTAQRDAMRGALDGLFFISNGKVTQGRFVARKGAALEYECIDGQILVYEVWPTHQQARQALAGRGESKPTAPEGFEEHSIGETVDEALFQEWHRRECPDPGECKMYPDIPWTGGWGVRWDGRTCREVYESERPSGEVPGEPMPPYPPGHICQMGEVEPMERKDCPLCKHLATPSPSDRGAGRGR